MKETSAKQKITQVISDYSGRSSEEGKDYWAKVTEKSQAGHVEPCMEDTVTGMVAGPLALWRDRELAPQCGS